MSVPATAAPAESSEGVSAQGPGQTGASPAPDQRADPTQVSSANTQEQPTRSPDYIREAFARMRGYTQTAAPAPQAETNGNAENPAVQAPPASSGSVPESEGTATPPASRSPQQPATTLPPRSRGQQSRTPGTATAQPAQDDRLILTRDEFERQIQSETDRRLAKQRQDEQLKAEREREVELRRTDPFEYARLMEEREAQLQASQRETERLTGVIATQLQFYDRGVLDPFVGALPEPLRAKVISKSEGIEGRKETALATAKALRSHYLAEGRASAKAELMKDQTFIKEVLARYGATPPTVTQSAPVLVRDTPSNGAGGIDPADNERMNSWMREASRSVRSVASR